MLSLSVSNNVMSNRPKKTARHKYISRYARLGTLVSRFVLAGVQDIFRIQPNKLDAYLLPMQRLVPLLNDTFQVSNSFPLLPSHRSGRNFSGSGKTLGLSWIARALMETIVYNGKNVRSWLR